MTQTDSRFEWVDFYMEFADKLLAYKDDRSALLRKALPAIDATGAKYALTDQFKDGTKGPLQDICPFTLMSTFNRGMKDENRTLIARALGKVLGVDHEAPTEYDAIPIVRNTASWFFKFERIRESGDIDALWEIFKAALALADTDTTAKRRAFIKAYDRAQQVNGVRINLSLGLYWIRPHFFVSLDSNNRSYIENYFDFYIEDESEPDLDPSWPNLRTLGGDQYLQLRDHVVKELGKPESPVSTIPELSQAAYDEMHPDDEDDWDDEDDEGEDWDDEDEYDLDSIMDDGCFLSRETLDQALERLQSKKNLILQGPPGTGKTWLAKRLAYALIGRRDETRKLVRSFQFHVNMSYEDFVRGYRPNSGDGGDAKLELVDGPFLKLMDTAGKNPNKKYLVVIEEINRGNPAQIFGELLTLLEADKRNESEAMALAYPRDDDEQVHIPENIYIIGTMNLADRSLALVDFALRRRFAFIDLEPMLGEAWRNWMSTNCELDDGILDKIEGRFTAMNNEIAKDSSLGKNFRIGHSVVTPSKGSGTVVNAQWFASIVDTEIRPLLAEYWFDSPDKVDKQVNDLKRDI